MVGNLSCTLCSGRLTWPERFCRDRPAASHLTPYQPTAQRSSGDRRSAEHQAAAAEPTVEPPQNDGPAAEAAAEATAAESAGEPTEVLMSEESLIAEEACRLAASLRDAEHQTLLENTAGDSADTDDIQVCVPHSATAVAVS